MSYRVSPGPLGFEPSSDRTRRQRLQQTLHIYRLDEVKIEARRLRAQAVFRLSIAGDRDEQRRRIAFVTQAPREFIAVHAGQSDVEQRHIGEKFLRRLQRLRR